MKSVPKCTGFLMSTFLNVKPLAYWEPLYGKRVLFTNSEYSDGMQQSAAISSRSTMFDMVKTILSYINAS